MPSPALSVDPVEMPHYVGSALYVFIKVILIDRNDSHIPDPDFRCVYPCGISLPDIPVPACGKEKTTVARPPHLGRTSICDVVVMLK